MKIVYSIRYNKKAAEYIVKLRDTETGKMTRLFANGLDENEIIFAKTAKHRYEDASVIIWC
jgi:hypothetical protein